MIKNFIFTILIATSFTMSSDLSAEVTATGNDVTLFTGTNKVKIIFENKGLLYLVDFSKTEAQKPAITPLPQTQGAVVPNLSPNGEWIVYGKGPSGDMNNNEAIKSSAFITTTDPAGSSQLITADNAHEPRFQIGQEPPNILYSTLGKWNAWSGTGEVHTKSWDGKVLGSEKVLTTQGSFYGGYDGQYLATGSQFGVVFEPGKSGAVPDTVISYGLYKSATKAWDYNARQVCNVSLSSSVEHRGVIMGLDFGSSGKTNDSLNNGSPWGLHDILLMADPNGKILKTIRRPDAAELPGINTSDDSYNADKQHWDDPEWTNHPFYAIANLQVSRSFLNASTQDWDNTDLHERIFLINLKDSTHLELVRSTDLTSQSTTNMQWPVAHIELPQAGIIEPKNWLMNAGSSAIHPFRNRQDATLYSQSISFHHGVLKIERDWAHVNVFNLKGKLLLSQSLNEEASLDLTHTLVNEGLVLFQIQRKNATGFQKLVLY